MPVLKYLSCKRANPIYLNKVAFIWPTALALPGTGWISFLMDILFAPLFSQDSSVGSALDWYSEVLSVRRSDKFTK